LYLVALFRRQQKPKISKTKQNKTNSVKTKVSQKFCQNMSRDGALWIGGVSLSIYNYQKHLKN
jgi:hypothetical protein